MTPTIRDWGQRYPHLVRQRHAERVIDIAPAPSDYDEKPTDAQLDDESLYEGSCYCPSKQEEAELVADDPRCERGAHSFIPVCQRCGKQASRFDPDPLQLNGAWDE